MKPRTVAERMLDDLVWSLIYDLTVKDINTKDRALNKLLEMCENNYKKNKIISALVQHDKKTKGRYTDKITDTINQIYIKEFDREEMDADTN